MKAIVVNENGGPEKVTLAEVDAPEPGTGQLQVAVETAGVNYLDIYQRQGAASAPFVSGVEGVGRVTKVGADVDANFVKSLADAGYTNLSAKELVRLRVSGVDANFIRELSKYRTK